MEFKTAKDRLGTSSFWLQKIREEYESEHFVIESYCESFLLNSRSVCDYVITDFIQDEFQDLPLKEVYKITKYKNNYRNGSKKLSNTESNKKLVEFLDNYQKEYEKLVKNPLVAYFFTLRNLLTHFGFPSTFNIKNIDGVKVRRFNHGFIQFLSTEDGFRLLTEDGTPLALEQALETIGELDYVEELNVKQKQELIESLDNDEPIDLLGEFLKEIKNFVAILEK